MPQTPKTPIQQFIKNHPIITAIAIFGWSSAVLCTSVTTAIASGLGDENVRKDGLRALIALGGIVGLGAIVGFPLFIAHISQKRAMTAARGTTHVATVANEYNPKEGTRGGRQRITTFPINLDAPPHEYDTVEWVGVRPGAAASANGNNALRPAAELAAANTFHVYDTVEQDGGVRTTNL